MLGGNRTLATKRCENWLLRAASVRCKATTHIIFQMLNRQVGTLSGNSLSITVVIFCWHICLISESMGHHDSEIMDDGSID
jgi:hypothetical protein